MHSCECDTAGGPSTARVDEGALRDYRKGVSVRHFSLEEARALIPQIRPHLRLALQFHAALRPVVHAINDAGYDVDWEMLAGEVELDDEARPDDLRNLAKARALYESLRSEIELIEVHGCEVKGVVDGLVDFRSWRSGTHEVSLCWKLGEPTLMYWHEINAGFSGRRAITDEPFEAVRRAPMARRD